MSCAWEYLSIDGVDFDKTWTTVKEIILKNFAGDPVDGVPSPSVQNTIYLSQRDILAAIKEVTINIMYLKFVKWHFVICISIKFMQQNHFNFADCRSQHRNAQHSLLSI